MTRLTFHNMKNEGFYDRLQCPHSPCFSDSAMTLSHGPLGQSVAYASQYDPSLLFPIARSHNRAALNLTAGNLPFTGVDLWNAYE
ncbi:MAG: hypothetical protein ACRER5_05335, partial [Pseudomonas sp.]